MRLRDIRTPQVVVDRTRLVRNIGHVQVLADAAGVALRPHVKTHKSPLIARWQIEHGARGICCAKVGEAEVFAAAGFDDIRLAFPVDPSNANRIVALMERSTISIIVDNVGVANRWSDEMVKASRRLDVLAKIDVGFHRCGIDPARTDAVAFLRAMSGLPGLRLRGLLSHAGHGYAASSESELAAVAAGELATLMAVREGAAASGIELAEVSIGATPTLRFSAHMPGATELRPGNYVYFDRTQVALGAASLDDCALTVLATVVSIPAADRVILDCGTKILTSDAARGFTTPAGYGAVLADLHQSVDDGLFIERLSEEHATVRATRPTALVPGDRVRVLPNHSCVVANMVDEVLLADGEEIVQTIPVAARGKST